MFSFDFIGIVDEDVEIVECWNCVFECGIVVSGGGNVCGDVWDCGVGVVEFGDGCCKCSFVLVIDDDVCVFCNECLCECEIDFVWVIGDEDMFVFDVYCFIFLILFWVFVLKLVVLWCLWSCFDGVFVMWLIIWLCFIVGCVRMVFV